MGKLAVITGATSGIGAAFARKFAEQKYDLILTGRREHKIRALADELNAKYGVNVEVLLLELSNETDLNEFVKRLQKADNVEILVNNAGFSKRGKFAEIDFNAYEEMLKVHAIASMRLMRAVLPKMLAHNSGSIINVSSIMAFFPFAYNSMYTATKAFMNLLSESIYQECKGTNVKVQALCPGLTVTDFHERMGLDVEKLYKKSTWLWMAPMKAEKVVAKSLKYLAKNKPICIPGLVNKLIVFIGTCKRFFWK